MRNMFRWMIAAAVCLTMIGGLWLSAGPSRAQTAIWQVDVFNNATLSGTSVWSGQTSVINYNWGLGQPVINGVTITNVGADNFSVRFSTTAFFTAGTYRFTVQVDDGARLYVDGTLLINSWINGSVRTLQGDYAFPVDGNHTIVVEMFDAAADAVIIANWALISGPGAATATPFYSGIPWGAEFFNGPDLAGPPIYTATYPPSGLNQNWGLGSPGGAVPVDNFSARFTRTLTVPNDIPKGVYTFYGRADDNFRFYVDQTLIFDRWTTFAGDTVTAEVTLLEGPHDFRFEYRDLGAQASLFLTWTPPNAQNPILPPGTTGTTSGTPVPTGINATVTISTLNVRSAPTTTAPVLTKITKGQVYPVTGRSADNLWAQITVNGQSGWAYAQYLSFSGDFNTVPVVSGTGGEAAPPPPPPTNVKGMVMGNLRIRSGPSTRASIIGIMPWGAQVDILGRDAGHAWYKLNYNGLIGWSYAPWIRITEGSFDELPYLDGSNMVSVPPPTEGVIVQAYGNVRVRSGPGLQYPKISKVVWGTRVQVLARSTDGRWYKIQHGDIIGWTYAAWYRPVQGDITAVPVSNQ